MKNWKDNVYFVLVEPREPGNIGASARAVKNMDFRNLCLVNPPPIANGEARWFARNAGEILDTAESFSSFREAAADKYVIVGTSRRKGKRRGVFMPVDQGMQRIREAAHHGRVALLFGREDRGLYNEEIDECAFLINIPASREQPSLNLAQAVMIIAYELSKQHTASLPAAHPPKVVNQHDLSRLYRRMEEALKALEYIPPGNRFLQKKIMQNLKHCLGRTGMTEWELNMFHGICKQIEKKIGGMNGRR